MFDVKYLKHFDILKEIAIANGKVARARVAAAIVYHKRIISVGVNSYKSSPFQVKFSKNKESIYFHAEVYAIKNALRNIDVDDFKYVDLLICRVKYFPEYKKYGFGLAKPCDGCLRAINTFNIRNVYYTGEGTQICQLTI